MDHATAMSLKKDDLVLITVSNEIRYVDYYAKPWMVVNQFHSTSINNRRFVYHLDDLEFYGALAQLQQPVTQLKIDLSNPSEPSQWDKIAAMQKKLAKKQQDFPHVCPKCQGPAYIGFNKIDCAKGC